MFIQDRRVWLSPFASCGLALALVAASAAACESQDGALEVSSGGVPTSGGQRGDGGTAEGGRFVTSGGETGSSGGAVTGGAGSGASGDAGSGMGGAAGSSGESGTAEGGASGAAVNGGSGGVPDDVAGAAGQTAGGGAGTGGTEPSPALNGCSVYVDRTDSESSRTIVWDAAVSFRPEHCMKIAVGQQIVFEGDFDEHPLEALGGDTPSPFSNNGPLVFHRPGIYGYFCTVHTEMLGAIWVVP